MRRLFGRFFIGFLASCLLLAPALPALAGQAHYYTSVSATETNTNVDIKTNLGVAANTVIVINDGANEVFVDFADGVAALTDMRIDPGDPPFKITSGGGSYPITNVGVICSASETATVRIYAFPSK